MTNWLKRVFALSDQGAKDLNKAIWCYTITNLSLLLPMCLIYMLLRQWIFPLMGFTVQSMSIWGYIGLSIVILAIIYGLEYLQLNSSFLASYSESAARRISIAERHNPFRLCGYGACFFQAYSRIVWCSIFHYSSSNRSVSNGLAYGHCFAMGGSYRFSALHIHKKITRAI